MSTQTCRSTPATGEIFLSATSEERCCAMVNSFACRLYLWMQKPSRRFVTVRLNCPLVIRPHCNGATEPHRQVKNTMQSNLISVPTMLPLPVQLVVVPSCAWVID